MKKTILILLLNVVLYGCEGVLDQDSDNVTKVNVTAVEGRNPSDVIDGLEEWKITLPFQDDNDNRAVDYYTDRYDDADEIADEDLLDYSYSGYFDVVTLDADTSAEEGVRFRAHAAGATTSGSKYPRSELRQRVGGGNNYWDSDDYQKMVVVCAITEVPEVKPEVCIAQIHAPDDEPLRVQYSQSHTKGNGSSSSTNGLYILQNPDADTFDATNSSNKANAISYTLGQKIEIIVEVDNGEIYCKVTNLDTGDYREATWEPLDESNNYDPEGYFKVGMYTQSSMFLSQFKSDYSEDEDPDSAGEMVLYSLELVETY